MYFLLILRTTRRSSTRAKGLYLIGKRVLLFYRLCKCQYGLERVYITTRASSTSASSSRGLYLVTGAGLAGFSAHFGGYYRVFCRLTGVGSTIDDRVGRRFVVVGYVLYVCRFRFRAVFAGLFLASFGYLSLSSSILYLSLIILLYYRAGGFFREIGGVFLACFS